MSFSLAPEQWCAWQMLPGYTGERCVPYFSPLHVRRVRPLKTRKQVLELDYVNVLYAEGVQFFSGIRFQVLTRAANYLVARVEEPTSDDRVAVLSHIEFGWLAACCPGVLRAFPPARLGSPYDSSISLYLDFVFLQRRALDPRTLDSDAENEWLIPCALRFDGYRYAAAHGHSDQPFDFAEAFVRKPDMDAGVEFLMAAMFMLQRRLMKEGVQSKTCQAWRIFRSLFLRLCREPVPGEYRHDPTADEWETMFLPRLAEGIQIVSAMDAATEYEDRLF